MKYQFDESMKEVLKIQKGGSDALNRKIFHHSSATEKNRHRTYFYPGRFVACALAAVMVLLTGGIGISYAAGVKPVQVILDRFSKRDESVIDKKEHKGTAGQENNHKLTMNEYYLDAFGNAYMAFSVTKQDGSKEKDLAFGTDLKAYYTDAEKNETKEFSGHEIRPIYSEQMNSFDGIQVSLDGAQCLANGCKLVIEMGREKFTFSDIKVTQPHYYEWESPEGSIFLSSAGMTADTDTKLCDYIDSTIGEEDAYATVVYKDGHQDTLQLSAYYGVEDAVNDDLWRASIRFSPYTELEKHLKEGWTWEEVKDEWKYNFSTYIFKLDEISTIQMGDIVLDVSKASYH